jgi:pimeloyl-ACP methyl ester carboxylesterase
VVALIALSICGVDLAAAPAPASVSPIKNIVLVHGAFADGSSWAKVIPILQARGYNITPVQNPLTWLADDALSENLPNAVLLVYPDSGHGSLFQFHESFTRQAAAFLASDSPFAPY